MRREFLETAALVNATTAMFGGLGLAFGLIKPPVVWLAHSPFHSFLVPGLILAIVSGGSALIGYFALVEKARSASVVVYGSGLLTCICILAGIAVLRSAHSLLYLYFVLGVVLMAGSYTEAKMRLLSRHL